MKLPSAEEISGYDLDQAREMLSNFSRLFPGILEQNRRQGLLIGKLMEKVTDLSQGSIAMGELSRELYLARLQKIVFGDKSERRTGDGPVAPAGEKPAPKKGSRGRTAQPELPLVDIVHELTQDERKCDACGLELKEWAGQFEESEMIQVIPARYVLERHRRQKYVCSCGGCIKTAPGPLKLKEGSRYSPELAVEIAAGKYDAHLPLDRQVRLMKAAGLRIESQTAFKLVDDLAFYLRPLADIVREHLASSGVFGGDETTWKNLGKKKGDAANKRFQLWALSGKDGVYFEVHDSRSGKTAEQFLRGLKGVLVCDAYAGYDHMESEHLLLAACWAHVRRRFVDAEKDFPRESKRFLSLIRKLYRIEERLKGKPPDRILQVRLRSSVKIVNRIRRWLHEHRNTLPSLALGDAVNYALKQWHWLKRFLDHPGVPLDNNWAERALRGPVIGRKNHFGSRTLESAQVAQVFYTLIETCKMNGVDSRAWMRDAIVALLNKRKVTMPWEIAATRDARPAA